MAVTGTARIPALPPNALGAIAAHLQNQHGAQPAGPWRVRFRPFRPVRNTYGESTSSHPTEAQADRRKRRVMWDVTDAAHPQHVFLVMEDATQPTRAELRASASSTDAVSHPVPTRWHAHVVSAEFHTLLRQSGLPGPLGSAAGTPGPGAWVQRGAHITLDGLSFRVRVRGSHSRNGALDYAAEHDECILSIGNVVVGTDRVSGGMVEIQYLPLSHLSPDSTLLGSILVSLLPPDIVPLLSPLTPSLSMAVPTVAPRTMLPAEQLEEIVPASTAAWRMPPPAPTHAPGFEAWDDSPSTETTTPPSSMDDAVGWTGIEARRRMAYVHLSMLRTEGLA
ncbi:hypothetical protein Malapachy_0833 [Malassezia pachydermatis]|uniref:Mediator complex subunit 20 n=1 Tax=Malassezia pachydermatis TaxID=77020 RepID=A0A0M8MWF0_9BASI|nr:hypothetical protein Malapachy_0833 [Malassezia pachydermatis]KOS14911.1 hypothetical protein Malapachy_0833 [Malassezia pachydermatis]